MRESLKLDMVKKIVLRMELDSMCKRGKEREEREDQVSEW